MSLKQNTIANYFGLAYTTGMGIAVFPLFLQYLGAEAFGLVGFFTMMQAWMQLLDMGMSPLLGRQTAYVRAQNIGYADIRKLVRSLEVMVFGMAVAMVLLFILSRGFIVDEWLDFEILSSRDVKLSLFLMVLAVGLRLFSSLYRSGIQGMEAQVRLNVADIIIVSLKFVGALLWLQFISRNIVDFFIFQLVVSLFELAVLSRMFYQLIPAHERLGLSIHWAILKPVLPFAGGIAYTAGLWVMMSQTDKLVMSYILSLNEYGYYMLVAVVANGLIRITAPVSQAILPRMVDLVANEKIEQMLSLYRNATQFIAVIIFPLAGFIALFSTELLFVWTGDYNAALWGGEILAWFALGNGILAISAFQFYLQYAYGKLAWHVVYSSIAVLVQTPIIIYAAFQYGAKGVAITWFVLRLLSFMIWPPLVHHKFAPGIHRKWLLLDIAPIFLSTAIAIILVELQHFDFVNMDRVNAVIIMIAFGLISVGVNALVSKPCRNALFSMKRSQKV